MRFRSGGGLGSPPSPHRFFPLAWPALVFALALLVRLYAIDRQSLWADEGSSIALSSRSLARIFSDTAVDAHPPLYYWVLHIWMSLFGTSVFAVRSLSAVCGALTASLVGLLGRRWFGRLDGAIAAVAALLSPLAIHYSQETRMYTLAALLGALAWLAFERWLVRPDLGRLALYWLAALGAICTHYFAAALVAAINLIWAIDLVMAIRARRAPPWTRAASWLAAQALLLAVYLPLALRNRVTLANCPTIPRDAYGPAYVLADVLRVFSRGISVAPGWSAWPLIFLALALAGLAAGARRKLLPDRRLWAAAWLLVPLGLMLALALRQPLYQPRFLLPALPGFLLLIGHGAAAIGRRLRAPRRSAAVAALLLALGARQALLNEWFDPAFWRDDYRGMARDVAATAGSADALMFMGLSPLETFDRYYQGPQPRLVLPRARPIDQSATVGDLEQIASRYRRLYAFFYVPYEADPEGVIAGWLREHAFVSSNRWYGGVELVTYELGGWGGALQPVGADFGTRVRLERAGVEPTVVRPKEAARIVLEWRATGAPEPAWSVFAHLQDQSGTIVSQYDIPLLGDSAAPPGDSRIQRRMAVPIPPDAPPGRYRLMLGVYDPSTGARLPVAGGADQIELAEITVARP